MTIDHCDDLHHERPGERLDWIREQVELHNIRVALRYLASNLAIGAALCRAFTLGIRVCSPYVHPRDEWTPGCGRSAP